MCSGSEAGSYLWRIDFVHHSTLGLRVISFDLDGDGIVSREDWTASIKVTPNVERFRGGLVFKAHRLLYHSPLGLIVIKKKKKRRMRLRTTTLQKCAAVPRRARI